MIFRDLLYILQSENYDFIRFLRFAYTHPKWWKLQGRQSILWTQKARLLFLISASLSLTTLLLSFYFSFLLGFFMFFILVLLLPIILSVALLIIMPIDFAVKERIRSKAKKILSQSGVTVIGITGSYGKTSAKSFLSAILKEKFDVIETPGNINTDIGIAEFVIKNANLFKKGSVFIVEMGAHRRGDIKKICDIAQPDYSILTGINETHLERFGSLGNIIQGKFELPLHTKKFTVINFDDANVQVGLSQYQLSCECIEVSQKDVESFEYKENFSGIWFVWKGSVFESKMLARHNATLIILCATLAERLGVSHEDMIQGISKLAPVKHRIEPIFNHQTGVTVLDDSYNGNFDGVKSAIEVLSQAKGRKIVLTPGLVELGNQSDTIHHQIGELYAKNVDLVLLIKTPMVKAIINGMKMKSFSLYTVYSTAQKAHEELSHVLKRGDTILFQNDVTDNYL